MKYRMIERCRKQGAGQRPTGVLNQLERDFGADEPNTKWATNIYVSNKEGFWGMLKRERIHHRIYQTRAEARANVFDYIERFHNARCRRRLQIHQQKQLLLS